MDTFMKDMLDNAVQNIRNQQAATTFKQVAEESIEHIKLYATAFGRLEGVINNSSGIDNKTKNALVNIIENLDQDLVEYGFKGKPKQNCEVGPCRKPV